MLKKELDWDIKGGKWALNVQMSVDDGNPEGWNKNGRSEGQSERSG